MTKDEQGRTIISTCDYLSTEGLERDNYDKRIKEFMDANPDVNINPTQYTLFLLCIRRCIQC